MSTTFDESKHRRATNGRFTQKEYVEADGVEVDDTTSLRSYLSNSDTLLKAQTIAQASFSRANTRGGSLSHDYTAEDVMQSCFARMFHQMNNSETGDIRVRNPGGFLRRALESEVVLLYRAQVNRTGEDDQAVRKLEAWREKFTRTNRREPSASEVDTQADEIRENWPDKRHRPRRNFHRSTKEHTSLDATYVPLSHSDAEYEYGDEFENPHANRLARNLSEGEADQRSMSADAWKMLAFETGAPSPKEHFMDRQDAAHYRRVLGVSRGMDASEQQVDTAVREFEAGEVTERTEALFAPFGRRLSSGEKQDVVDTFKRAGKYSSDMYDALMSVASQKRSG